MYKIKYDSIHTGWNFRFGVISTNSLTLLQSIFHLKLSLLCLKPLSGFSKLRIKSKPGMKLPLTTTPASGHPSSTTKPASLVGCSTPWSRSHLRASAPRAVCSTLVSPKAGLGWLASPRYGLTSIPLLSFFCHLSRTL